MPNRNLGPRLDCFDQFTASLIRRSADKLTRYKGFSPADYADIVQEFALHLFRLRAKFDPTRASWAVFATKAAQNLLLKLLDQRQKHLAKESSMLAEYEECKGNLAVDRESNDDLSLDIKAAIDHLPELERQVCWGLMAGDSQRAIARRLKVSPFKVRRLVKRIRTNFQRLGLTECR